MTFDERVKTSEPDESLQIKNQKAIANAILDKLEIIDPH